VIPIYILGNCNTQIYLGLQHEEDIWKRRSKSAAGSCV
jgi:hypothetical protein